MSEWAYVFAAITALGTIVYGALGMRNKAQRTYVETLRDQLKDRDEQITDCERERRRLLHENQWLRDQLMGRRPDGGD